MVRAKPYLTVLVVFTLLFSLASLIVQLSITDEYTHTTTIGKATSEAQASFCLNAPPQITYSCNTTLVQDTNYACQLNITDDNGGEFVVSSTVLSGSGMNINMNSSGYINFTPDNDDVGTHYFNFTVVDETSCANNEDNTITLLTVENINDPPYLSQNISDQEFAANTSLSAFFLNDYFTDPDDDELNYSSTIPSGLSVNILSSSEVIFSSTTCLPDGVVVRFTASDPYNATADSNQVEITVTCDDDDTDGSSGDTDGGGGGAGGGSANTCRSEWICQDWWQCIPTGYQWQRCYDENGCDNDRYFKRECEYVGPPVQCNENWLCSEWGNCLPNGTQQRECQDLSVCGSAIVRPAGAQECVYYPTCNDGILNGDEEDTDCGGNCPDCSLIQQPLPISDPGKFSMLLILLIILSVLIGTVVLRYYKGQIAKSIATLGFLLKHSTYKDILLNASERNNHFEKIKLMEKNLGSLQTPNVVYDGISGLIRAYLADALVLPLEMIGEEINDHLEKLNLRDETKDLLKGIFEKLEIVEQEELEYDEYFVRVTLEELRTAVCLTSDYSNDEIVRPIEDILITDDMSFYDEIFVRSMNLLRALQFDQVEIARKEYLSMLTMYDPLTEQEKEEIYPELKWVFQAVKFRSEMTGGKIIEKDSVRSEV